MEVDIIKVKIKMTSYWIRVGPKSNVSSEEIEKDTQTHRKKPRQK